MSGKEVIRRVRRRQCEVIRQSGSYAIVRCNGGCQTTVPIKGRDLPVGTLRAIRRHLSKCIGDDW